MRSCRLPQKQRLRVLLDSDPAGCRLFLGLADVAASLPSCTADPRGLRLMRLLPWLRHFGRLRPRMSAASWPSSSAATPPVPRCIAAWTPSALHAFGDPQRSLWVSVLFLLPCQRWGAVLRSGYVTMVENQEARSKNLGLKESRNLTQQKWTGAQQASCQGFRLRKVVAPLASMRCERKIFWEIGATSRFTNFRRGARQERGQLEVLDAA